ncbi:hypothetical protein [Frigoribacterium sp. PhB118]|uniref:hypothetical protein n=1 Tax=Frigoribacterium sp. PhB118 TaxID=2485175 RepID=UPI000F49A168|nr:hypothetical protein [Frigoribacterium sp. PhB118]ROS57201.1 hypothetical protein EDF21_0856 [Frigoribacterium sp. PhB118]
MADIAVTPFALTDATVKVAADNFAAAISAVEFVPTVPTFNFTGLTPSAVFNFSGAPAWVVNLSGAQDWATATSISNYLLANQGKTVEMQFAPIKGGKAFKANVTIVPTNIGGTVNTVPVFAVTLQVQGQPTPIAAVTA